MNGFAKEKERKLMTTQLKNENIIVMCMGFESGKVDMFFIWNEYNR